MALAPLNTWQHFRNLELHLAIPKGLNNSAFPIALYKIGCRDQEKGHIIKMTVQKQILKSHSSKLLFVKFTNIYKYQIVFQLVYLDFLRLDCTALVMSVGEKEGYIQLKQFFTAMPFRQATLTKALPGSVSKGPSVWSLRLCLVIYCGNTVWPYQGLTTGEM